MRFGREGVLKILNKRIADLINELINHKGVCRTALATPGLLLTVYEALQDKVYI